ncbi:MAG: hypothetical protein EOO56_01695 [Hymenobacter sp.]|nr:MAG: hypothetical protein EOO56_01695 [Hymenobacter sp.]
MLKYSHDSLTVIVEPSSGILRAAWGRPLLTANLIDSYYHLLEEAEAQGGCRFWHLDLRLRIWPQATFMHWLIDTFAPLATQRLGGPVYVACWMDERHQQYLQGEATATIQARLAKLGYNPVYFDNEPAARAWLLRQQALDTSQY